MVCLVFCSVFYESALYHWFPCNFPINSLTAGMRAVNYNSVPS